MKSSIFWVIVFTFIILNLPACGSSTEQSSESATVADSEVTSELVGSSPSNPFLQASQQEQAKRDWEQKSEKLEQKLQKKGWRVSSLGFIDDRSYFNVLEGLLEHNVEEIHSRDITIYVSSIFNVSFEAISIDHQAPIKDIVSFVYENLLAAQGNPIDILELEKMAHDRGWKIFNGTFVGDNEYRAFLQRLLILRKAIGTKDVNITVDNEFAVRNGWVHVDAGAPLAEMIAYLRGE